MKDPIAEMWNGIFSDLPRKRFPFVENEKISALELDEYQFHHLMLEYRKGVIFPNLKDFILYVELQLRNEAVPDSFSCRALLSGNSLLIQIAEDLEVLNGAWYPNETTKAKIDSLKEILREEFA